MLGNVPLDWMVYFARRAHFVEIAARVLEHCATQEKVVIEETFEIQTTDGTSGGLLYRPGAGGLFAQTLR
jgi:hypothetical protein